MKVIERGHSFVFRKRDIGVFFTTLFVFLPSNVGSLQGIGSLITLTNNFIIGWILLNFLYRLGKGFWSIKKPSYICLLCISFYVVRMILVYLHGGSYVLHNWISLGKTVIAIIWFEWKANKSGKNRRIIMYAFWFWVLLDALVTFIWPEGSPLLNGGYLLGWKNNKIEFLFIGHLLALIEIERKRYAIHSRFFQRYICFSAITIAMSYIVDSGTTLLIILLLTLYIPLRKLITSIKKFPSVGFIVIFHIALWCLVILNLDGRSVVGMLIERFTTRDATFTGRTYVWAAALFMISKAPLTGYVSGFSAYGKMYIARGPLTGMAWEMAHNQVLEILMQGGAVLFGIFAVILLLCLYKNHNSLRSMRMARWALFCLILSYLTEAYLNSITFVILLSVYYVVEWCKQDEFIGEQYEKR